MSSTDSPLFVKSVEKAFAVLNVFSRDAQSLTLAEIAARADLDKSSAQRFVYTLHTLGYLLRDSGSRSYRLSPRMLQFGFAYLDMDPVVASTEEALKALYDHTGETINLARLDGADIVLVARLASKKILSVNVRIGSRLPALYMASGRVLVSHLPREEQERIITQSEIKAHTEFSLTDTDELRTELHRAAQVGYCVTRSQYFRGDLSIAAPIVDARGIVVASVSANLVEIDGPNREREKELIEAVVSGARACSRSLGAQHHA